METGQNESKTGPLSVGVVVRFFNLSFLQIPRSNIFFLYIFFTYIHIYMYLGHKGQVCLVVCKHVLYEPFFVEMAVGW